MSNRKRRAHRAEPVRRAAHRAEPVRTPLSARVHDVTPARLAQGGVVAVLVAGLCTTVTGQAAASSSGAERTAAVAEAREGALDVATDALAVAQAVQVKAASTGVASAKLTALRRAAAHVDELIAEAEARGAGTKSATARATTQTPDDATDGTAAGAQAAAAGLVSDDPTATAAATDTATATPAAAAGSAADEASAGDAAAGSAADEASGDAAADDPSATPTASDAATPTASDAATPTASDAGTAAGTTVASAEKSAPPAPSPTAATATAPTDAAATDDPPLDEVDVTIPTIPETAGPEDETTEELRAAVAALATIAQEIQDQVAQDTADQQSAAEQAAADKTAADAQEAADAKQAEAEKAAAAKRAAAEKAAQRAAWKKSLQGYPNGRIPAKALCSPSFDKDAHLRCDAAEALDALDAAYTARFGHHLEVNDSYRSYSAQVACRRTKGYLCAVPGTSNHGWGVAVDLGDGIQSFGTATHRWMVANAAKYGWKHPGWAEPGGSKPEPWHWEYVG